MVKAPCFDGFSMVKSSLQIQKNHGQKLCFFAGESPRKSQVWNPRVSK